MTITKKQANQYIYLFALTYFISYITRTNYGTIISEMVTSTGLTKSALSMALTGSFITYGVGQLISGYFGDKIQPKKLVAAGLIISIGMNIFIPICTNTVQMTVVWCINGFAQAFMWPPLVKLMATLLSTEDYNRGCVRVSWGGSFGTMFIYLISPLLITAVGWKSVFIASAVFGVMGLILWLKACPEIEMAAAVKSTQPDQTQSKMRLPFLLIFIMAAIILQGILRDGVATWMPSYISETYGLSNEISIFVGVVLPIFSIICHQLAGVLYGKKFKNPVLCASVIYGVSTVAALLLYVFSDGNAISSVFFSAILTGCMHGVNLLLICINPPYVAKTGKISTISGLLNACTYVGSAVSAYIVPLATEKSGWSNTMLLWFVFAAAGTLICLGCIPMWKKLGSKK